MTIRSRNNREHKAMANRIDIHTEATAKIVGIAINVEDIAISFNVFSEELEYIFFSDTDYENDVREISDVDFVIQNFNGQTIASTDYYQELQRTYVIIKKLTIFE